MSEDFWEISFYFKKNWLSYSFALCISNVWKYISVSPCETDTCQNDGLCIVNANQIAICICRGDFNGPDCSGRLYFNVDV